MDFSIEVDEGCIQVESVCPMQISDEVAVFEINCKQKYSVVLAVGSTEVLLGSNSETMFKMAGEQSVTRVRFQMPPGEWELFFDTGRYSHRIVLFRRDWSKQDQLADLAWYSQGYYGKCPGCGQTRSWALEDGGSRFQKNDVCSQCGHVGEG